MSNNIEAAKDAAARWMTRAKEQEARADRWQDSWRLLDQEARDTRTMAHLWKEVARLAIQRENQAIEYAATQVCLDKDAHWRLDEAVERAEKAEKERDEAVAAHRNVWAASGELEDSLTRWKGRALRAESDAANWRRNILSIERERDKAIRIMDRAADANVEAGRRIRDLTQEARDERGAARDQMEQVKIRDARIAAARDVLDGWTNNGCGALAADIRDALDGEHTN